MLNRSFLLVIILSLFFCGNIFAQNTCDLTGFVTYTQVGWGSTSNSTPGKIRDQYFSNVFPNCLKIGSLFTLKLTTAKAVDDFLPQGGQSGIFSQNCVNPLSTTAGVFAGQLVALAMNIGYDNAGKLGTNTLKLENLVIASGTFAGLTVSSSLSLQIGLSLVNKQAILLTSLILLLITLTITLTMVKLIRDILSALLNAHLVIDSGWIKIKTEFKIWVKMEFLM
jgi:hypothetical protein